MNLDKIHSYIPLLGAVASGLRLLFVGLAWSDESHAVAEGNSERKFSVEYVQNLPHVRNVYILTDNETEQQYIVIKNEHSVSITPRLSKEIEK